MRNITINIANKQRVVFRVYKKLLGIILGIPLVFKSLTRFQRPSEYLVSFGLLWFGYLKHFRKKDLQFIIDLSTSGFQGFP